MRPLRAAWWRFRGLFGPSRDGELEAEIESHLRLHMEDNLRSGMNLGEARRDALLRFGAIESAKEEYRDRRGIPALETLFQDLRYALRTLRKTPGFTAVVILTLALGVGANTAMFNLIDAVLLQSLPVWRPEQLVFVNTTATQVGNVRLSRSILLRDLTQMQQHATQVAGLASYAPAPRLNVNSGGRTELASGHFVSGTYCSVLGVHAVLGRIIQPADDHAGGRVALLGYGYWRSRFNADPGVLGKLIVIDNVPFSIIGVVPPEFYGLSTDTQAQLLLPMATMPQLDAGRLSSEEPKPDSAAGYVFARLKDGVSQAAAAKGLSAILRQTEKEAAGGDAHSSPVAVLDKLTIELTPAAQGVSSVRNRFSKPLKVLMVVVALVMLIACANIANLLLAKSTARRREIAVRLSLGSSRRRLVRQLLTESLVLSVLGAALGIVFAIWGRDAIIFLATAPGAPAVIPAAWNLRVFGFTAAVSIVNALLFGLAPALRATGVDLAAMLKTVRTGRAGGTRLGNVLVAGQVAISLVLLIGAALFLDTFRNLGRIDVGFDRKNLLMIELDPTMAGYRGAKVSAFFENAVKRAAQVHGVRAVTLMRNRILVGQVSLTSLWVPGYALRADETAGNQWVVTNAVGPDFFAVAGMHLTAGRDFSVRDNQHSPRVAVINQTMAEHFFGGKNALGRQLARARGEPSIEIVGVVRDIAYLGLRDRKQDVLFTPILQDSPESWSAANLLVRMDGKSTGVIQDVRAAVQAIDAAVPAYAPMTMDGSIDASLVQERLLATLSAFFAVLALGLSAVGLYGVLSYGVVQRTSEIGLRMALGASRTSILRLLLGETMLLLLIGTAAGLALALGGSRFIASLLYGVTAADAASLTVAVAVLSLVALLAGFLPARRASRVEPVVALHYE